jgi:hypothetical protein
MAFEGPRVYTYSGNFQLFCKSLINSLLRPTLQALKRKRVFAEDQTLEVSIMKLVQSLVVAAALAIPAVAAFAQSNEAAASANSQAVQVNNAAQDSGGVADGTSASGSHQHLHVLRNDFSRLGHKIQGSIRPDANDGMKPIYFGS